MPVLSVRSVVAALPGRPALMRYRWELWLLFGIPAITGLIYHLTFASILELLECASDLCHSAPSLVHRSALLLLLAVSWRAVRRQGREFLILLWMLEIVTTGFSLAVSTVGLALGSERSIFPALFTIPLEVATSGSGSISTEISYPVTSLAYLIVKLWFARRASRISTGHAFLIVLLSFADSTFAVHTYGPYALTWYVGSMTYLATQVALNVVMFWMMVRFDASAMRTRWFMTAAVLGGMLLGNIANWVSLYAGVGLFAILSDHHFQLWGMRHIIWLGLFVVVPLALAWLVRVPQPKRDWLVD